MPVGSDTEIHNLYREATGRQFPGGAEGTAVLEAMRGREPDEIRNMLRGGWQPSGGSVSRIASEQLENEIASAISELEAELQKYPLEITEEEMNNFLQKAVEQITPYYDKKKSEIEAGIQEGKIRSAEDVLMEIRTVKDDLTTELKSLDIRQAKTEEEFVNTIADITSSRDEDFETKRFEWKQRVDQAKMGQIQSGTLTSGVGRKYVQELLGREEEEKAGIERRAAQQQAEAETARKYDLQAVSLAREAAEKERARRLGTAEEEATTTSAALGTLGLSDLAQLPSEAEIARRRGEYTGRIYTKEALTDIGEEEKRATESRRMELAEEERAIRQQEAKRARERKVSELAQKYKRVAPSLLQSYLY